MATTALDRPIEASSERRILPLDGLRALAIGAVFLHHALDVPGLWIGVDLFFVLSGYLITMILLRSRHRPDYFSRFYRNRAFRIFPLYFAAALAAVIVFGNTALRDLPWIVSFTSNIARAVEDVAGPTTHFWSLAIEEQFYMLWPLVIWLCPVDRLRRLIVALLVAGPILRGIVAVTIGGSAAATLPFCRTDGLLIGAALAHVAVHGGGLQRFRRMCFALVGPLALGFVAVSSLTKNGGMLFSVAAYEFATLACAAAVVIVLTEGDGFLRKFLSLAPLVLVGRVSFCLYLVHLPILFLVWRALPKFSLPAAAISAVASVVLAGLSWRYFEAPLLAYRNHRFPAPTAPRGNA